MKNHVQQLVDYANNAKIKKFKRIILYVFIALVVLDIIFVAIPEFPSISRVIYNSSPKYIVLIWLFGLFISNIFLQRHVTDNKHQTKYFIFLSICTVFFLVLGFTLKTDINCANYKTEIKKQEIPYVTRVLCQEHYTDKAEYANRNCNELDCNEAILFKIDLTNLMKLFILILGIVAGYLFWPRKNGA